MINKFRIGPETNDKKIIKNNYILSKPVKIEINE